MEIIKLSKKEKYGFPEADTFKRIPAKVFDMITALGFCPDRLNEVFGKVQLEWVFAVEYEGIRKTVVIHDWKFPRTINIDDEVLWNIYTPEGQKEDKNFLNFLLDGLYYKMGKGYYTGLMEGIEQGDKWVREDFHQLMMKHEVDEAKLKNILEESESIRRQRFRKEPN